MPYHMGGVSLQASRGDPFFHKKLGGFVGGLAKRGAGFVARRALQFAPGPVGIAARFVAGQVAPRGRPQQRRALRVGQQPGVRMMQQRQVRAPAQARPRRVSVDEETGEELPKARRMNPLNPRALSRATRRLASFTRRVRSVEKQLRKIAPRSRSRPRADLGRGHRHVR